MTTDIESCFEQARSQAAQGKLVVVRADKKYLLLPALPTTAVDPKMLAAVARMIPPTTKRNVAVIGETAWASSTDPNLQSANRAIPFFGMLMGISCLGHSVWVFDGSASTICAGCRHADLLIVDGASVSALSSDWQHQAKAVMRNPQILIHDRATYKLLIPK